MLHFPIRSQKYILEILPSDKTIIAILKQRINLREIIIAYADHPLNRVERSWPRTERDAYGNIWSVEHFKNYLYGAKFTIKSNFQLPNKLVYYKNPASKIFRWQKILQNYNFDFEFCPKILDIKNDSTKAIEQGLHPNKHIDKKLFFMPMSILKITLAKNKFQNFKMKTNKFVKSNLKFNKTNKIEKRKYLILLFVVTRSTLHPIFFITMMKILKKYFYHHVYATFLLILFIVEVGTIISIRQSR